MKFLSFVLALLLSAAPVFAQIRPHVTIQPESIKLPQSAVNLPALKKRVQPPQKDTAREQALQKLAERQNPKNWKRISWKAYKKANENAKKREGVCTRLVLKCSEDLCGTCPAPIPFEIMYDFGQGEPDYKTLLSKQKLIYIADANNHDTKAAPLEVAKILHAVRETNPDAKILLAVEFLNWASPYNALGTANIHDDLLHKYHEYYEYYDYYQCYTSSAHQKECDELQRGIELVVQELNNPTTLLKKAGTKTQLDELSSYEPVFRAADKLGIDQLALDDNIFGYDTRENIGVKIGEYVVWAGPNDNIPSWDKQIARENAMSQLIGVSSWGVLERNREWARRIKAVLPAYDIVLVYAGSGHLAQNYYIDLQPMVEQADFTNISLYPQEKLPEELNAYYQQRWNTAEKHGFSQDTQLWNEREKASIEADKLFAAPKKTFEYNPAQPLWIIMNDERIASFLNNHQEQYRLFIEESEKQEENYQFAAAKDIEVYLPAE